MGSHNLLATWRWLALLFCSIGAMGLARGENSKPNNPSSHAGPVITVTVQRGAQSLPIFYVDKLQKGDTVRVGTDRSGTTRGAWALVLALVSPASDVVISRQFDLTAKDVDASIAITADDQVPVIVIAPQVKTLFGLSTSFEQSASLIADAITNDPQRFLELQKIEQINLAIASLTTGLDSVVLKLKTEQAVDSAKSVAAKFGVKSVDPECFKNGAVDTRCVATSIVSSRDLKLPSMVELGSLAQPFATATLPADILANVRLVAAASSFLSNKYRDQYDFAPSFAKRDVAADTLQLFANARFQNGDIKTAYVYVPSWFAGQQPELSLNAKHSVCLAGGELPAQTKGQLALSNYWHGWTMALLEAGSAHVVATMEGVRVVPEKGVLTFDPKALPIPTGNMASPLEARLTGQYAFTPVSLGPIPVALPWAGDPNEQIQGLASLVAGDKATLRFSNDQAMACVERLSLLANGTILATAPVTAASATTLDLTGVEANTNTTTNAQLEITQTGRSKLLMPVRILPRRALVSRMERHELENDVTVFGQHLDRIASLVSGDVTCTPSVAPYQTPTPGTRIFSCPPEVAQDGVFPSTMTVVHGGQEPPAFETGVTRVSPRPHLALVTGKNAPLIVLSTKAVQWGLSMNDPLVAEDSGLALVLRVAKGYKLVRGSYALHIRFGDEPQPDQTPFSVPLMSDLAHNELRTRSPINFQTAHLPSIINPAWFRVVHQPSGFAGDWMPLHKSVISLPALGAPACRADGRGLQIAGTQLDLIDWASRDLTRTAASDTSPVTPDLASLAPCDQGLCLGIDRLGPGKRLKVKVQWVDERLFEVSFPTSPTCPPND